MLAQDGRVAAAENPVQDVNGKDEIVQIADRTNERLRHEVERQNEIRHGAAEEHFVLPVDAAIGRQAPQQDEDVRDEHQVLGRFAENAALAVEVFLNGRADAVVEAPGALAGDLAALDFFANAALDVIRLLRGRRIGS